MKKSNKILSIGLGLIFLILCTISLQLRALLKQQYYQADHSTPTFSLTTYHPDQQTYYVLPASKDGVIDVNIKSSDATIDVNIDEIDTYDKLKVHLESADSYSLRNAGPLEVKVD